MLRYFSYECENGDSFEKLVQDQYKDSEYTCPVCDALAHRVLSPTRFKLDGTNPNNQRAWNRWEKDRLKQIKHEEKQNS